MRILILDTYYPQFLKSFDFSAIQADYQTSLRRLMEMCFGTFDAYSHYLKAQGWECADVVANYAPLQNLWSKEHHGWTSITGQVTALQQISDFKPDVVFLQDVSFFDAATLRSIGERYFLAAQISCPMPNAENVSKLDCVFTSFPHYVDRLKAMGVGRVEYMPLAFDPRVLPPIMPARDVDISFVGGVGKQSHWNVGTDVLERVAAEFGRRFHWYGYGLSNLRVDSPLRACYYGPAWGNKMYDIYLSSKIVVNRHGEVAQGYSNNLRMYEATGCGAVLMTEESENLRSLFPAAVSGYKDADALIEQIHFLFSNEKHLRMIGTMSEIGQKRTLEHHTYAHRMEFVSQVLTEALVAAC